MDVIKLQGCVSLMYKACPPSKVFPVGYFLPLPDPGHDAG